MQINQEFLCFEKNEKIIEELASQNNHQEIIDFCDSQISSIKFSQINSLTNQTHILDDSLELYKATEQSSGSQILSRVDSFVNKFQIEHAYEVDYKQKTYFQLFIYLSIKILQRYQEIIECCDQLQILCSENNQEIQCQKEKTQALIKQDKLNEFIQLMGLDKQENKHNMNYYLQMGKEIQRIRVQSKKQQHVWIMEQYQLLQLKKDLVDLDLLGMFQELKIINPKQYTRSIDITSIRQTSVSSKRDISICLSALI